MPESVGQTLRKARESRNLSIDEVSEKTRIPKRIISVIEEDKEDNALSPFYIKNFTKSYAKFLKAAEEITVKDFLQVKLKKNEGIVDREDKKNLPQNLFIQHKRGILIICAVIFGIWLLIFSFKKITAKLDLFHSHNPVAAKLALPHSRNPVAAKLALPKKASIKDKAILPAAATKANDGSFELGLTATLNIWLQVTGDGELLFKGMLKKGSKETWNAKKEIRLWVGNAGGVLVSLNGKNLGRLGKKDEIKNNIVVTKKGIKL